MIVCRAKTVVAQLYFARVDHHVSAEREVGVQRDGAMKAASGGLPRHDIDGRDGFGCVLVGQTRKQPQEAVSWHRKHDVTHSQ